ncbi:MAG: ABC transporter substrate-binding protein [Bacteroidota bacterium]
MKPKSPQRIVCLTEETTEWFYLLGEEHRIVGISAFTERPARAKEEKPVVSAFTGGSIRKIKALEPDLVIGFSDVQASLAHDLIKENLPVLITNQRSVQEILDNLLFLARMIGAEEKAMPLLDEYATRIAHLKQASSVRSSKPKVYFEEWDEPRISAIQWVSELIEIAGGTHIFADRASGKASKERGLEEQELFDAQPDIYMGCWCGKPVDMESVRNRPGYDQLPFVQKNQMFELDPAIILQPGPACLTDGLDALIKIIRS